MLENELKELIAKVVRERREGEQLEVKAAAQGCPKVYETLSSFANGKGGVILFGIDERKGFAPNGVYDAQDLIHRLTEQALEMEPTLRVSISSADVDGKAFVSVEVPSLEVSQKPCHYRGRGKVRGSFIRVGDADLMMNEGEIRQIEDYQKASRHDIRASGAARATLDEARLSDYLQKVRDERPNARGIEDGPLLELLGITRDGNPTLAGVLCFSLYPQAIFPRLGISCFRVSGKAIVGEGEGRERFIDDRMVEGRLDQLLEEGLSFVRKNMKRSVSIDGDGKRVDEDEYPMKAIREALLNAIIHRDYSPYTEGTPIALEMYEDRLEIVSPGMLYGPLEVEELGRARGDCRNKALLSISEAIGLSENRYSGIPTILDSCQKAGLPRPSFISRNGYFKVIFYNKGHQEVGKRERDLLSYCHAPRSRKEISSFLGKSPYYAYKRVIEPLLLEGYLGYLNDGPVRGNKLISIRDA